MPVVSDSQIAAEIVLHTGWRADQIQEQSNTGKKKPNCLAGCSEVSPVLQDHFHIYVHCKLSLSRVPYHSVFDVLSYLQPLLLFV